MINTVFVDNIKYLHYTLHFMAIDPKQKLEALNSELSQVAENYNKATQVVKNCEQRIHELRGGIAALEEVIAKK